LASLGLSPKAKVFGCEPLNANDAAISLREGKIFSFENSPSTIADGARTLAIKEPCFTYLKKIAGILEIEEEEIILGQKELSEILNMKIEPTSALAIAGAKQFLKNNLDLKNPRLLVLVSGGNIEV
jgi:threonine dehydratase